MTGRLTALPHEHFGLDRAFPPKVVGEREDGSLKRSPATVRAFEDRAERARFASERREVGVSKAPHIMSEPMIQLQ